MSPTSAVTRGSRMPLEWRGKWGRLGREGRTCFRTGCGSYSPAKGFRIPSHGAGGETEEQPHSPGKDSLPASLTGSAFTWKTVERRSTLRGTQGRRGGSGGHRHTAPPGKQTGGWAGSPGGEDPRAGVSCAVGSRIRGSRWLSGSPRFLEQRCRGQLRPPERHIGVTAPTACGWDLTWGWGLADVAS